MRKIAEFVQSQRLYLLLLVFVVLMGIATMGPEKKQQPARKAAIQAGKKLQDNDVQLRKQEIEKRLEEDKPLAVTLGLVTMLIIVTMALGIVLDAIFLSRSLSGKSLEIRTYLPSRAPWNLWDVAKVTILFVFFGYMIILIESALVGLFPIINNNNLRMVVNSFLLDVMIVVFILYFTSWQYKVNIAQIGLTMKNFSRNIFYGVVGYIATIPVLALVLLVTAFITNMIGYVPEKQAVVELFLKEKDTAFLLFTSLFAAIAGPIIEELFFRGFMYGAVKKYAGVLGATLVTAILFALVHAHAVGFFPILVLGVVLAYLYEKTGSLVSSMTMHAVHNLIMVSLVFLVKQFGA